DAGSLTPWMLSLRVGVGPDDYSTIGFTRCSKQLVDRAALRPCESCAGGLESHPPTAKRFAKRQERRRPAVWEPCEPASLAAVCAALDRVEVPVRHCTSVASASGQATPSSHDVCRLGAFD